MTRRVSRSHAPELRNSGTPPRPSAARSGRWLAGEASETEGRSDQRVARLAQRTQARKHASTQARNPSELVPSVLLAALAGHLPTTASWGGVPERSTSRSRDPELRNSGIPELLLDRAQRGRGGGSLAKPARRRGGPINGLLASRSARKHASTQARKHASKQASTQARNPSELVPSVLLAALAVHLPTAPPWGGVPERSTSRSRDPELRNSGTPEFRNSSLTERSDVGEVARWRSQRDGGEVRSTGCSPREAHASTQASTQARKHATRRSWSPPSCSLCSQSTSPHDCVVGRCHAVTSPRADDCASASRSPSRRR